MAKCSLEERAMQTAKRIANRVFRRDPDREAKTLDAISSAWEFAQSAPPDATPGTIALYAVKRVGSRRQFRESAKSVTGPNPRHIEGRPTRVRLDLGDLSREGEDPAVIAALRIDIPVWWKDLTPRKRRIAEALAVGCSTEEAAALEGVTPGRVSQVRRELAESWAALDS